MKQYKLVHGEDLEFHVNEALKNGWEIHGNPVFTENGLMQALVRGDDTDLVDLPYILNTYDISQASIYRLMRLGEFPESLKKGKNVFWYLKDVKEKLRGKEK